MGTPEDIKAEYTSSLADLTFNSKPLINMLTMLAEENLPKAKIIVEAIEEHLAKVAVDVKLPVLYLIDCIVKNVGQTYTSLFSQNIVFTFCTVFKKVDEKTRSEMFKLRQTWNDVLPQTKLYAIDVQINQIDPAWPITAQPSSSIHFNPRFLVNNSSKATAAGKAETATVPARAPAVRTPAAGKPSAPDMETLLMQEQLIQKQKELLELQRKTLELEVLQTQVKLQEQMKTGRTPPIGTNILLKPEVAKQLLPENMSKSRPTNVNTNKSQTKQNSPSQKTSAAARTIRDPRLLRQQQSKPQFSNAVQTTQNPEHETTNKTVHNKQNNVKDNPKDPRFATTNNNNNNKKKTKSSSSSSSKSSRDDHSPASRSDKSRGNDSSPRFSSNSASSLSSASDSPTKKKSSSSKSKKRDRRPDPEFEANSKREKVSPKTPTDDGNSFKIVKNKNRIYARRNLESPPAREQSDDFRTSQNGKEKNESATIQETVEKPMDVDLRQLPPIQKKRLSTEAPEPPSKKSRSFDVLFGSEDTDLRQLPVQAETDVVRVERPPTPPPPPIISIEKKPGDNGATSSPKKSDLDAVRAKLANATNREKVFNKSFHKNKLNQDQDLRAKVTISQEEEQAIQSGHLTNEQSTQMLTKILTRFEKDKLMEAKRKDHEERLHQDEEDDQFNDKDERIRPSIVDNDNNHPQTYNSRGRFRNRGGNNDVWKGRLNRARQPIKPWLHQQQTPSRWHNNYDDDSSRSPGNNQEIKIQHEENKTLNIDGIARDIRVYNETAVIFLNYDDPREISFQNGARRVIFNNKESYLLTFGSDYTECKVNGYSFRVKLGVPSREIFINDLGFECFFGGPQIHITVNNINIVVALDGPPPQVKIGETKRTDLVVGKINLVIDATLMVPVFLDGKLQKFDIDNQTCTIKFVDALKRVLINDVPYNVEFGGLPKPCVIHSKKHFIRFSVLPKGVKPGYVKIRDMEGEGGLSPVHVVEDPADSILEAEPLRPDPSATSKSKDEIESNPPTNLMNILQPSLNNLDVISNVFLRSLAPTPATTSSGYQVELPGLGPSAAVPQVAETPQLPPAATAAPLNVNELFQKLVASGLFTTQDPPKENRGAANLPLNGQVTQPKRTTQEKPQQTKRPPPPPPPSHNSSALKPVSFLRPESLKVRQSALYATLYAGMQCSSCGMRFPPEASMLYSQHLDWHFRQNRRGKKNARVASSRNWYYSLSDWKNYEELEDLEEREKNYFDQQQQQADITEDADEEVEIPTVPANPSSTDERCCVCRDVFEQFFNEEKEEWHLRNAIKVEDVTYHPVCYEDHQKSLMNSSLDDSAVTVDDNSTKLIPGLEIIVDDDDDEEEPPGHLDEVVSLGDDDDELKDAPSPTKEEEEDEQDKPETGEEKDQKKVEEDDDDVILNEVAPIKIVVDDDDDDDDEPMDGQTETGKKLWVKREKKQPAFDDGFEDVGEIVTLKDVGQVKIKSEPIDDALDNSFEDSGEVKETEEVGESISDAEDVEIVKSPPPPQSSHPQLITSMDGNMELVSANPTMPPQTSTGSGNKIKINISKPLPVINQKESDGGDTSVNNSDTVTNEQPMVDELEIVSYKPALQNVPLRKYPVVKKGAELTGLCSIM